MKKYINEEREKAIKDLEASTIKPDEWEGPHKTKVVSYKYADDVPARKKKGLIPGKIIEHYGGKIS
jgi:hypothetical protein